MRKPFALFAAAALVCGCTARTGRVPRVDGETGCCPAPVAPCPTPAPAPVARCAPPMPVVPASGPMDAALLARVTGLTFADQGASVLLSGSAMRVRFFPNNDRVSLDGTFVSMGDAARREGAVLWVPEGGVRLVRRAAATAQAKAEVKPTRLYVHVPLPPIEQKTVKVSAKPKPPQAPAPGRDWIPATASLDWNWIVIHHSDDHEGSCKKYDDGHRKKGWDGCGYHWVIGNGTQTRDGEIEVSERWRDQKIGAHTRVSPTDNRYNERGIGIVLVGDFETGGRPSPAQYDATVRLTRWLMSQYGISADRVLRHQDCKATACPGKNFPWARFKHDLEAGLATPP